MLSVSLRKFPSEWIMPFLVVTFLLIGHCEDPSMTICQLFIAASSFRLTGIKMEPSIRRESFEWLPEPYCQCVRSATSDGRAWRKNACTIEHCHVECHCFSVSIRNWGSVRFLIGLGYRVLRCFYSGFQRSIWSLIGMPVTPESIAFSTNFFLEFCNLLRGTLISIPFWPGKWSRIGTECIRWVGILGITLMENRSNWIVCNWIHQLFICQCARWFCIVWGSRWENWNSLIGANIAVVQKYESRLWLRQCVTAVRLHFRYRSSEPRLEVAKVFVIATFC